MADTDSKRTSRTRGLGADVAVHAMAPTKRRIGYGILDFLGGLPLFVTAPLYRHWHMRWGATGDEVRAKMPGDDIVPRASFNATRAITIDALPERVWPWIVQMGYRRAGFYTYDIVDNAGYPSADHLLGEYQHFAVGDWAFNMNSMFGIELPVSEFNAFKVKAFETGKWLLWEKPDSTWSWLLTPLPDGKTRLILRIRARPANLFWTLFMEFGDPPMARRMLRGIKHRAEAWPRTGLEPEAGHEGGRQAGVRTSPSRAGPG
jgi:hypothetical protein